MGPEIPIFPAKVAEIWLIAFVTLVLVEDLVPGVSEVLVYGIWVSRGHFCFGVRDSRRDVAFPVSKMPISVAEALLSCSIDGGLKALAAFLALRFGMFSGVASSLVNDAV